MKNNIKAAREKNKLTQQECADIFEVTLRAWQTYEQGVSEPKFEVLCRIADRFNVSVDYLLGRENKIELDIAEFVSDSCDFNEIERSFFELYITSNRKQRTELILSMISALRKTILDDTEEQ